jgi:hypothetical protein
LDWLISLSGDVLGLVDVGFSGCALAMPDTDAFYIIGWVADVRGVVVLGSLPPGNVCGKAWRADDRAWMASAPIREKMDPPWHGRNTFLPVSKPYR